MTEVLLVEPAHLWVPERRGSYADEVIDLYRSTGNDVDAEQALSLDALCSYGPGGGLLTHEEGLIEPRQQGKTFKVLVPVALADMFLFPPDRVIWTAHLRHTAHEAFEEILRLIDSRDEFSRRVKQVKDSHEEVSIELVNGGIIEFLARSAATARGLGGKRVFMDEALFVTSAMMAALFPTLAARSMEGSPQLVYASSAGLLKSDHLRSVRKRGRAGNDPTLIWVEFCAPGSWKEPPCVQGVDCSHLLGVEGCALDDETLWARSIHALDRRVSREFIRGQRRTFHAAPVEFGREWMGWWEDPPNDEAEAELGKAKAAWPGLADPFEPAPVGVVALAVAVPKDRSSTSIAVTWRPVTYTVSGVERGRLMVMVKHLPGTLKAVETIVELVKAHEVLDLSLHAGGPAGALLADLAAKLGKLEGKILEPRAVSTTEAAQATGAFIDLVTNGGVGHLDQPEINAGVAGATLRNVGEGKVWAGTGSADASLFAATLSTNGFVKHAGDELPPADIF
jgi:hypothetical protein